MRGQGPSTIGEQRKVDGAVDACRTDSHDHRTSANKPRTGRFAARRFSLPPAAAHSLLSRQKRMGGGSPAGSPQSPPGPPGSAFCESLQQSGPRIQPPAARPFSPQGGRLLESNSIPAGRNAKRGSGPLSAPPCLFAFLRIPRCPRSGDAAPRPGCWKYR